MPNPRGLSCLTKSHLKLDNVEEAAKYRQLLDDAMKLDEFKGDEECKSFHAEVIELFESNDNVEDYEFDNVSLFAVAPIRRDENPTNFGQPIRFLQQPKIRPNYGFDIAP